MVDKNTDKLFGIPELLLCDADGDMKPIGKIVDCSTSLESEERPDCTPTKNSFSFFLRCQAFQNGLRKMPSLNP